MTMRLLDRLAQIGGPRLVRKNPKLHKIEHSSFSPDLPSAASAAAPEASTALWLTLTSNRTVFL